MKDRQKVTLQIVDDPKDPFRKGDNIMSKKLEVPTSCYPDVEKSVQKWVQVNFGAELCYDDGLQPEIDQWGLPWFRAGAVIRDVEGKILMMHENRVQVKKIKDQKLKADYLAKGYDRNTWVDGEGGWNLPSGRLRTGESFETGAKRKVHVETGWDFELGEPIHIRYGDKPDNKYILPVYLAEAIGGPEQHEVAGTSEIGWFSVVEIKQMHQDGVLRSPEFVMGSLEAYERRLTAQ